jgi:hypothetical protein
MRLLATIAASLVMTSCNSYDNSSDTDRPRKALTNAESAVSEKSSDVVLRADEIEREKRDLVERQQKLVDDERALAANRHQLGTARNTLVEARTAYAMAVAARLSKLDAALATLQMKADATSKDAVVGLRARRDHLAARLQTMSATAEQDWVAYTDDVDATFDAIERDHHASR